MLFDNIVLALQIVVALECSYSYGEIHYDLNRLRLSTVCLFALCTFPRSFLMSGRLHGGRCASSIFVSRAFDVCPVLPQTLCTGLPRQVRLTLGVDMSCYLLSYFKYKMNVC